MSTTTREPKRRRITNVLKAPPDPKKQLKKLIVSLTKDGDSVLNEENLKEVKKLCKESNQLIDFTYETILDQIKSKRAQVRYSTLQLIDVLFNRSKHFRDLVTNNLTEILQHTIGLHQTSLPPPADIAIKLKRLGVVLLKQWNEKYGVFYKQLTLAYRVVKDNPIMNVTEADASKVITHDGYVKKRHEEQVRAIQNDEARLQQIEKKMQESINDLIVQTLDILEICFEMLVPKPVKDMVSSTTTTSAIVDAIGTTSATTEAIGSNVIDDGQESISAKIMRENKVPRTLKEMAAAHGLGSSKYELTITIPTKNPTGVKENLENNVIYENIREYSKVLLKHLDIVNGWLNDLEKLNVNSKRLTEQAYNLKKRLETVITRCEELGIRVTVEERKDSGDDDSDFEEVEIAKVIINDGSTITTISTETSTSSTTSSSLSEETLLRPNQPDITPCRARLKNGQLCPRRDLYRCPFHGTKVPRNNFGDPIIITTPILTKSKIWEDLNDEYEEFEEINVDEDSIDLGKVDADQD
ncbi:5348_t:CDS:2 [Ambispora leptoticha]|uniref:5348_t:CDS:1 n=1 Tax=Ambispora leptoticha TaxID=144679 RepID=A0A9N9BV53_9GLOM|nr:5348_t:CDS:2 [Ambispora leptoticha]